METTPPPVTQGQTPPPSVSETASFFESDEYLIFSGDSDQYGRLGKMVTSRTKTNPEGEFLMYHSGKKEWSKFFKAIRPAKASELQLGTRIYFFEGNRGEGDVYFAPNDKSEARTESWWRDPVTDNSLVNNRGVVTIGRYRVDVSNTFVEKK